MFSVNCNKNTLLSNLCFSKWSIQQITVLLRKGFFYKEEEEAKVEQILSCNFFLQFYYFPITMAEAIFLEMDPGQSKALILPTGWPFLEVHSIVFAGTLRKKIGPRVGRKKFPARNHPYILSLLLQHEYTDYTSLKPFYSTKMYSI